MGCFGADFGADFDACDITPPIATGFKLKAVHGQTKLKTVHSQTRLKARFG
jgi:hypothetical protein